MAKLELPTFVVNALKQIAIDHNYKEPQLIFSEGSNKGFTGLIKRCRIKENEKSLSIMCKFLSDNEEHNKKYDAYELFKREVYVYQKFHSLIVKFQIAHGMSFRDGEGFWAFPKCYSSEFNYDHPEKSFILMEDLNEENFETKDAFKMADFHCTEQIFIQLAKLHGISYALRIKEPEAFAEFKTMNDLMCHLMTTDLMKHMAPRNCQLASELFSLPLMKEKVLAYKDNMWEQIETILDGAKAEPFGVVCHGDCWINNVLFKYQDNASENIKEVRLIDWQMTRYGSGASELMYFLFCYNDKNLRDQYQEVLLKIYYEALRKILEKFDIDVNIVYPFAQYETELKVAGKFAFAMTTFVMPINCKYPEKLFKDKQAELTETEKAAVALYNKTMKDIICDLVRMDAL